MTHDPMEVRRLAADLILDAVQTLRTPPPTSRPAKDRVTWRRRWITWAKHRIRDVEFFRDEARSGPWCEAAGLDYDAVLERLEAEGALYDPRTRFPTDTKGRCLIMQPNKPSQGFDRSHPVYTDKERRKCEDCGRIYNGAIGLARHRPMCVGPAAYAIAEAYADGVGIAQIVETWGVHDWVVYRIIDDHGVERRRGNYITDTGA